MTFGEVAVRILAVLGVTILVMFGLFMIALLGRGIYEVLTQAAS